MFDTVLRCGVVFVSVKDFYRSFRAKEKTSFHAAKMFALECFNILPIKV